MTSKNKGTRWAAANLLIGGVLGVSVGLVMLLVVLVLGNLRGGLETGGPSMGQYALIYLGGGLVGGGMLGFLLRFHQSRIGSGLAGIVLMFPFYLGASILFPSGSFDQGEVVFSLAAAGITGVVLGLWVIGPEMKKLEAIRGHQSDANS